MAHALWETVRTGDVQTPVLVLVYEEQLEEPGDVWMARSILTDHVSAGTTPARARECLKRTVEGSFALAAEHGKSYDQWWAEQRHADSRFVAEFVRCASAVGRDVAWAPEGGNIAMAPTG